jgi:hypothetical protein
LDSDENGLKILIANFDWFLSAVWIRKVQNWGGQSMGFFSCFYKKTLKKI